MHDMLAQLLTDEFGIDADRLVPAVTLRSLELDSLSLAELAVMAAERTGVELDEVGPDITLGELAERYETVAAPTGAPV